MTDPMNDFEADVRQTARQLNGLDFSRESQQRENVRDRLMDQMYRQQPVPNKDWAPRKGLPRRRMSLYALAGGVAAVLVIGVIFLTQPMPQPSYSVEMIAPTPETVKGLDTPPVFVHPDLTSQFYYETLEEAAQIFQGPLYAPTDLPEGYVLAFVTLSTGDTSTPDLPPILTSVYWKKYDWRDAVMRSDPYDEGIDYLYIMQEAKSPTQQPQMRDLPYLLSNVFLYNTEMYTSLYNVPALDKQWAVVAGGNDYTSLGTGRNYQHALAYKDDHAFVLSSRQLTTERLKLIVDSMSLYPVVRPFMPEQDAPGTCIGAKGGVGKEWILPMQDGDYEIATNFNETHSGIDLRAPEGTLVRAASTGNVVFAGESKLGYGNTVVLSHGDTFTMYAHLNEILVKCGELVPMRHAVGFVGSTGNASGPHLHFEIIAAEDGHRIDPSTMLDFVAGLTRATPVPPTGPVPGLP